MESLKRVFLRNAAGSPSMCVDGSVTPQEFYYMVPEDSIFYFSHLSAIIMSDPGSDKYGTLPILDSGIEAFFRDRRGNEFDLLDGERIKQLSDYHHAGNFSSHDLPGIEGELAVLHIPINEVTPQRKVIRMLPLSSYVVRINDDLRTLNQHTVLLIGELEKLATINNQPT